MRFLLPLMLLLSGTALQAQSGFADSLIKILSYSHTGFLQQRYNEKQNAGNDRTYHTTLSLPGFARCYVQTSAILLYKYTSQVHKAFFTALTDEKTDAAARQSLAQLYKHLLTAVRPAGIDSSATPGFKKHYSLLVKRKNEADITIEAGLVNEPGFIVLLRIVSAVATDAAGIMPAPPSLPDSYNYTGLLPFFKAMLEYSKLNFTSITKDVIPNSKWNPTFESKVKFRDYESPKVQYVTHWLWNEYITRKRFATKEEAKKEFEKLCSEIDQTQSAIANMTKEGSSNDINQWWYIHHGWSDNSQEEYHCNIKVSLEEEYGAFYVAFYFIKMSGR